jgi:hypothetical protein
LYLPFRARALTNKPVGLSAILYRCVIDLPEFTPLRKISPVGFSFGGHWKKDIKEKEDNRVEAKEEKSTMKTNSQKSRKLGSRRP